MTAVHAMSVDVEDWFQVLNMAHLIDRADWDGFELRCGDSTRRLLDLFARRDAKATFFCLGWIAERIPDVIREIHELQPLDETPARSAFRDLLYALEVPQGWFHKNKILPGDRILGLPSPATAQPD